MKRSEMAHDKGKAAKRPQPPRTEAAFDVWLQQGLHQMFDDVAREPVPDELLKLIEGEQGT